MFLYRSIIGAVALLATTAFPSWAEDFALILTNRGYDRISDAPDAAQYRDYADALQREGFRVFGGQDQDARAMVQTTEAFRQALSAGQVERVVVVLSGRMAVGPAATWLLARDYTAGSALSVGHYGLSVESVARELAAYPGQSLLVLAPSYRVSTALGDGLQAGIGGVNMPQGVALMSGRADTALFTLRDRVLRDRMPLGQLAGQNILGLSFAGYLPRVHPLGGGEGNVLSDSESAYWSAVRDIDSIDAYRAYLKRFPTGMFVPEAHRLINDILQQPARAAAAAEDALNLSRDDRREIQRNLSLLGFDPRGIDGIFGPGTRAAISGYQRSKGWEVTGYVDAGQVQTLRQEALVRARQLEERERQRRLEEERQDRAYWEETGRRGDEDGLRRYLRRFPDGIYADYARERLDELERLRRSQADRQMQAAWDRARAQDTVQAYREFLSRYPRSEYAQAANDRIAELEDEARNREQIERDKAEEAVVAGNPITRLLVERALQGAGLNPGKVDGEFDKATRRAIRQFQRASDLPVTGFVSQATMVRLMTRIGR